MNSRACSQRIGLTHPNGGRNEKPTNPCRHLADGHLSGVHQSHRGARQRQYDMHMGWHARGAGWDVHDRPRQPGLAGTSPVLLYDASGNVVGSEQAQFLTTLVNESDPGYMSCGTPRGLTEATWSDTVELFASKG